MLGRGLLYFSFKRSTLLFVMCYIIIILYVLLNSFHEIAVVIVHSTKAFRVGGRVKVSGELHVLATLFPEETPFSIPLESGWAPELAWMS
jgi:hypothetical protein